MESKRYFPLLSAVALFAFATPARADKPRAALMPFIGPGAGQAEEVVRKALEDHVQWVTPPGAAPAAPRQAHARRARRRRRHSHRRMRRHRGVHRAAASPAPAATPDLSSVDVVITGALVRMRRVPTLFVTFKDPSNERAPVTLRYSLGRQGLDAAALAKLAGDVVGAFDKVAPPPLPPPKPETQAPAVAIESPGREDELPPGLAPAKPAKPAPKPAATPENGGRPVWAPYIDASAGVDLSGRVFSFDQPGLPHFNLAANPGIRVDATVFPLASLAKRGTAGANAASAIGLGASFDYDFWPDSVSDPCYTTDAAGNCLEKFGTQELRLEAGLRFRWNFLRRADRPQILLDVEYGMHRFAFSDGHDSAGHTLTATLPSVDYRYVTFGLGVRQPIGRFAVFAAFHYHLVLDDGQIHDAQAGYGPGSDFGLRANLGFDVRVYKGLSLGLFAYYERFQLGFDNAGNGASTTPPCPCGTSGGAADQYFGGALSVGYTY